MDIGTIGSGNIGSTLARNLKVPGHQVAIANSRGPATLVQAGVTLNGQLHDHTLPRRADRVLHFQ